MDRLEALPWDGAQRLLESGDDHVVVETRSRLFREEESLTLPIPTAKREDSLASTVFCQADDTEIRAAARGIVGEERNAWRAAKKIAEWVDREVTANYDVGFASAREILDHREGDCSEHTVLFVDSPLGDGPFCTALEKVRFQRQIDLFGNGRRAPGTVIVE